MYYISRKGYEALEIEYRNIDNEIIKANQEMGESVKRDNDLRENQEFMQLRVKAMYELPKKKEELYEKYINATIIEDTDEYINFDGKTVIIGSVVEIDFDGDVCEYSILGNDEGDIDNDTLSCNAPIAMALIGKKVGEKFDWQDESIKILKVSRI